MRPRDPSLQHGDEFRSEANSRAIAWNMRSSSVKAVSGPLEDCQSGSSMFTPLFYSRRGKENATGFLPPAQPPGDSGIRCGDGNLRNIMRNQFSGSAVLPAALVVVEKPRVGPHALQFLHCRGFRPHRQTRVGVQ